jgi:hypothetical protein
LDLKVAPWERAKAGAALAVSPTAIMATRTISVLK